MRKTSTTTKPYASSLSSTGATKASSEDDIPIIASTVDHTKDVGTGYGFRGWSYARVKASLSPLATPEFTCLDTGSGIIIADKQFFKSQAPDIPIRIMASPITVRGLGDTKHRTDEYAISSMYFPGIKDGKRALAKVTREVHLVDDLIGPEKIVIDIANKSAHIGSCDVTVDLEVKTARTVVHERVHAKKISPGSEMTIPVHHTSIPSDRDFLFEPDELNLSLYAHLVNSETRSIVVRNDSNKAVHIPRNCRLGRITELEFPNAFHIAADPDVSDLALRKASADHKTGWFKKVIAAAFAATAVITSGTGLTGTPTAVTASFNTSLTPTVASPSLWQQPSGTVSTSGTAFPSAKEISSAGQPSAKVILDNGITIHRSSNEAVEAFCSLLDEYPTLVKDAGFAELPEKY